VYDTLRRSGFTILLACLATGCSSLRSDSSTCPCSTPAAREQAPELGPERLMLSEGYSLLYRDASSLDLSGLILHAKFESSKVHELVTAVADFGGELKAELERIDRDYPGVRVDLDPLPEMEKRKRRAIGEDRARYFAPGIGKGGREYERTILIGLLNGINHERHMCQVMAEVEPDAGLKKFLTDTSARYDSLHDRIEALLETEYFRDPDGKTAN
jgi:hypothetical protein